MGKAVKWFRSLFTSKKPPGSSPAKVNNNNKWAPSDFSHTSLNFKNYVQDPLASPYAEGLDANKHAIAVAAATAAVAEAALAAAQAAAQVVRLTSGGGSGRTAPYVADRRSLLAAVKIQSAFRAYLVDDSRNPVIAQARRALRALKGLVKLQALVRGHIVRKQSADMLFRMQAMARIQARASAHRSYSSESSDPRIKFSNFNHTGIANLGKNEERSKTVKHGAALLKQHHSRSHNGNSGNKESSHLASRWLNQWMEQCTWNSLHETSLDNGHGDDERNDKILEVDTWKPHQKTSGNERAIPTSNSHYFSAWKNDLGQDHSKRVSSKLQKPNPSISSEEARTADNSPRVHSASSRPASNLRGPFTPARSECSRSVFGDYIGHPSYMANTESSRAKVRSHSAPKQRTQYEELELSSKYGCDPWELDTISEKGSSLAASNRRSNTYLYSGLVKRQGTPRNDAAVGFSSVYGRRAYR
ncbi:hypothetical protein C2S51_027421 [Perilla frutescens var. frutescens]|nr:hypothetical protein C2S51_027421 [Perilla frutescens var. frutescens]